ncbi:hypothetical protein PE36_06098 [Moritella sp. PE36]|nr:hypothetical protein PE36_06098 [Moritella sp. PE36]
MPDQNCQSIVNQGGDYLLAVKNNQGKLRKTVEKSFSHQRTTTAQGIEFDNGSWPCRVSSMLCVKL